MSVCVCVCGYIYVYVYMSACGFVSCWGSLVKVCALQRLAERLFENRLTEGP